MILNQAIRMRIYPDDEQRHKINVTLGHCRYIYNKMLERNTVIYNRRKEHLNYYAMQNLLPEMKKYLPWLKEADSQALKHACRQLNTAFDRFFHKTGGYPKFHTKHGKKSYTTTNTKVICVESHRVKLPCLGWIRTPETRIPDGSICYATVSLETDDRYYVSITYKKEVPDITPVVLKPENVFGLDYKSDGLYTDSIFITSFIMLISRPVHDPFIGVFPGNTPVSFRFSDFQTFPSSASSRWCGESSLRPLWRGSSTYSPPAGPCTGSARNGLSFYFAMQRSSFLFLFQIRGTVAENVLQIPG